MRRMARATALIALALASITGGSAVASAAPGFGAGGSSGGSEIASKLAIVEAMPLARRAVERGDIARSSEQELAGYIGITLDGLMLDVQEPALDTPQEFQSLIGVSTALQLLEARGKATQQTRYQAAHAAYAMHLAGYRYDTRPGAHEAVESLPKTAPHEVARVELTELRDSIRAFRGFARQWFPNALHAALQDTPKDPTLHNLRGLFLLREGRAAEAAQAFDQALSLHPKVQFAVNLYRAQVERGDVNEAIVQRLYEGLVKQAPGVRGSLERIRERYADRAATAAFEAPGSRPSLDEKIRQVARYIRLDRSPAALVVVRDLLDHHSKSTAAIVAAAEAYLSWEHFDKLVSLLDSAKARQIDDRRLLEVELVAVGRAQLAKVQGQPTHAIAERDLDALLAAYRARVMGPEADLIERTMRVFLLTAKARREAGADGEAPKAIRDAIEALTKEGLQRHPSDPRMIDLAVGAQLGLSGASAGIKALEEMLAGGTLGPGISAYATFLLARLEAGLSIRKYDPAPMNKALERLARLDPKASGGLVSPAEHAYVSTVAQVAVAAMSGKRAAVDAVRQEAIKRLDPLIDAFEVTDSRGALLAQSTAMALAALAFGADNAMAHRALQRTRMHGPRDLGLLGYGLAAILRGDPQLGLNVLSAVTGPEQRPGQRFAAHKWSALAGNQAGAVEVTRQHLKNTLELWDAAGQPEAVEDRVPRPIFVGDLTVSVGLSPGEPLAPDIRIAPVVVLVPDFAHDKGEVTKLLDKLTPKTDARSPAP